MVRPSDGGAAVAPAKRVQVPLGDLKAQYKLLKDEILSSLNEVAESTAYVLGPKVAAFEKDFAAYAGTKHCVGVNSGTSALHLALICAGVGAGDEVISVPMTFIATSWAISYAGATPVYVDVDPDTATMDASLVEKKITGKTKALLPVHLYGQPADMEPLLDVSKRHGIPIVEDVAQAHGATYRGHKVGTMGQTGCFSFYPGKNLGAYGEGGMVTTNNAEYARTIKMLRDWGAEKKYQHVLKGYNFRLEGIQGAVLRVKLKYLEKWTEQRRAAAARYDQQLAGTGIPTPHAHAHNRHVYHIYAIRTATRAAWQEALNAAGVQSGIHYPIPVHLLPAYADLGYKAGQFPHSERAAAETMSLPMFPELTVEQCQTVASAVKALAETNAAAA